MGRTSLDDDIMENYPAKFYEAEKGKPLHVVGYTVALGMMGIGVAETAHGIYYGLHPSKRRGSLMGYALGPILLASGGVAAYSYLKYAKVIY